jgi:hypothetical protein
MEYAKNVTETKTYLKQIPKTKPAPEGAGDQPW